VEVVLGGLGREETLKCSDVWQKSSNFKNVDQNDGKCHQRGNSASDDEVYDKSETVLLI